ncbi:MAG: amino acid kinase [Euryarchaeota archaeon]|nr:amino acid kinase [Euryarchaeota archaeon]
MIKIGGSLIESARRLVSAIYEYALNEGERILIVPGGGIFADTVRTASNTYGISDETAHWMAVLAMDQYAYYLSDGTPARLITEIESIPIGASVLLTYNLLKKSDAEIEHTWDVTSDTIAGWIASKIGATFIKATDVDGIFRDGVLISEITAEELIKMGGTCVDPELPGLLLSKSLDCQVVNGEDPDYVIDAIKGVCRGTVIRHGCEIGRSIFR